MIFVGAALLAGGRRRKAAIPVATLFEQAALANRTTLPLRLLFRGRLLSETSFDRSANCGQHLFGGVGVLAGGRQLQILIESFGGAFRRDHLVALDRGFAHQVDALPVVGIGAGGIGLQRLVERSDSFVHFARVGEHGAFVEIVRSGIGGIILRGSSPLLHRFVGLARFGVSLGQCAVVNAGGWFEGKRLLIRLNGLWILLGAALGLA